MNPKFIVAIAAVAIIIGAGAVSAYYMMGPQDGSDTQSYTDLFDNKFEVKNDVGKIVVESGAALRFVSYMGTDAVNTIVGSNFEKASQNTGSTSYSYVTFPNYTQLSKVDSANAENIIALNPDLVLIGCSKAKISDDQVQLINTLKQAKVPVCVIKYVDDVTTDEFNKQVNMLGKIFKCETRATELLNGIASLTSDLSTRVAGMTDSKNVYVGGVAFMGTKGFDWSNVAYGGMLYLAPDKIVNVASLLFPNETYAVEVGFEKIYNAQTTYGIDIAVLDLAGYSVTKTDYDSDSSKYTAVDAINDGRFYYALPQTSSGTLHDNTIIASYSIGKIVAGDEFDDVDLVTTAKQVYSLFLGSTELGNKAYNGIVGYVQGITGSQDLFGEVSF